MGSDVVPGRRSDPDRNAVRTAVGVHRRRDRVRPAAGAIGAALLGCAVACGAGVAGEPQTRPEPAGLDGVHNVTMVLPAAAVDAAEAMAFESLVESLSTGRIAVAINAREAHCDEPAECLAALRAGVIDVYRSTVPDIGRLMPELHVLDVPYLLETDEVVDWVFRGAFFARMRDALLHRTGLRLMALGSAGGWRGIATTSQVVRTPADVQGLTLRTAESPVEVAWARALGALPEPAPGPALPSAVASGRVGGSADGVVEIVSAGLEEGLPYLTQDRHGYRAGLWLMNEESYQELPSDLRQLLTAGFDELARSSLGLARERASAAAAAFEAADGTVHVLSAAERRAFVMAAGRVSTWYMEEYGYEWLVWLEGAIAEAEREIALAHARREANRP